jgi:hypothetical protein
MSNKYYVALIISKNPFVLPEDLSADEGVQHLIVGEFEMDKDIMHDSHSDCWRIKKSAPENCDEVNQLHCGYGSTISVVILDWLRNLCKSVVYRPIYFRLRKD